ncbi:FAD-dependent oxidoreductase [Bacillus alkalicellulosilyticus]|uniref:FAD-dependent oxidoreductase n=1 Tax=Alkalihalobacterium alkalicellulosilyticum TaxID=1912214 RepID=UPI0009985F9A|nr:FAD-dependent oxidoreductase [Bacillus alkalicellulosilyticus]
MSNHNQPNAPEPYWRVSTSLPTFPHLAEDIHVDVAVVGGGMTGITTAYLLTKQGIDVALIEADSLANGTTGHTTAKITAQHGLIYDEFIQHFGTEQARLYYEANDNAKQFITSYIEEKQLDAKVNTEDAFLFTNSEQYLSKLENEFRAYEKLGIQGGYQEKVDIPVEIKAAVRMDKQAQFHPLQYLKSLLDDIVAANGKIYENTPAVDIQDGKKPVVITKNGSKISCNHVVCASHYPFKDGSGLYFSRLYADRSYVVAVKPEKEFSGGMYINAETPTRSLRYTIDNNDEKLILVSGEHHKTGQGKSTLEHYRALEEYAKETIGIKDISYRWSAQDLITPDKLPYVGSISTNNPNIYVAAGYRKWGMTNSTVAAHIISDIIQNKHNQYTELYSPSRFVADPSIKKFIKENVNVAKEFITGKLDLPEKSPEDLGLDEGSIVNVNGVRCGAYKNKDGEVFVVDSTCTHMYCEVEWNSGERTWDCPCHGSRYAVDGEVIEGPAKKPLNQMTTL